MKNTREMMMGRVDYSLYSRELDMVRTSVME